jgi:DNA-binding transcriptional regulator YhcF (GntR family)
MRICIVKYYAGMDEIRDVLIAHGKRRAAARRKAKQESDAIRELIPQALDAGLSKSEIARLAQITRPALDTMLKS